MTRKAVSRSVSPRAEALAQGKRQISHARTGRIGNPSQSDFAMKAPKTCVMLVLHENIE
jgi:hypothetical protein